MDCKNRESIFIDKKHIIKIIKPNPCDCCNCEYRRWHSVTCIRCVYDENRIFLTNNICNICRGNEI